MTSPSLALHSTPAPATAQVHDLDPTGSDRVAAVSIYSMYDQLTLGSSRGSRKVRFSGGYNVPLDANPFNSWATVLDCGE